MKNIYLHSIANQAYADETQESIETIEKILSKDYILSRNEQDEAPTFNEGYNGNDRVSLCDYDLAIDSMANFYHAPTSYEIFIQEALSFIFNKSSIINPIYPIIIPKNTSPQRLLELQKDPDYVGEYFSDLLDEVQVKDKISLDYMEGITIPLEFIFKTSKDLNEAMKKAIFYLNNLDELLRKYKRKNRIYALEDFQELKTTNDVERALLKVKENY